MEMLTKSGWRPTNDIEVNSTCLLRCFVIFLILLFEHNGFSEFDACHLQL